MAIKKAKPGEKVPKSKTDQERVVRNAFRVAGGMKKRVHGDAKHYDERGQDRRNR